LLLLLPLPLLEPLPLQEALLALPGCNSTLEPPSLLRFPLLFLPLLLLLLLLPACVLLELLVIGAGRLATPEFEDAAAVELPEGVICKMPSVEVGEALAPAGRWNWFWMRDRSRVKAGLFNLPRVLLAASPAPPAVLPVLLLALAPNWPPSLWVLQLLLLLLLSVGA